MKIFWCKILRYENQMSKHNTFTRQRETTQTCEWTEKVDGEIYTYGVMLPNWSIGCRIGGTDNRSNTVNRGVSSRHRNKALP